jgi:hypothetical protein
MVVSAEAVDLIRRAVSNQRVGAFTPVDVFDARKRVAPMARRLPGSQVDHHRRSANPTHVVEAAPAEISVVESVRAINHQVEAWAGRAHVLPASTFQVVISSATDEPIPVWAAIQPTHKVATPTAHDQIAAAQAFDEIVATLAFRLVGAGSQDQPIPPGTATNQVVSVQAPHGVVPSPSDDHVPCCCSDDPVVSFCAD